MRFLIKLSICFLTGIFMVPLFALAQTLPEIKVFNVNGQLEKSISILDSSYDGPVSFAAGDTLADDAKEIVVCQGAGLVSKVLIYNLDGSLLDSFMPFAKTFKGGCQVTLGDNNGDLKDEIIVGAGSTGGPQVKIFKGAYEQKSFFAFSKSLTSGVRVATTDLGSDGKAEIIAFSNYNQSPEYVVFGNSGNKIAGYKLTGLNNNAVSLVTGDFNGDGVKEIAYLGGYGTKREINIVGVKNTLLKTIAYADTSYQGSLNLAARDVNGDGQAELVLAEGYGGSGKISIYNYEGALLKSFSAYDNFAGGLSLVLSDIDNDGQVEILTMPEQIGSDLKNTAYKFATVDLTTQMTYRYQDGKLLDTFLISSGKAPNLTPPGTFTVTRKRPSVRMSGPGYDLPGVPWVTSFNGPYTFHGTYWHSNFGQPMSHGCVNMKTPEAKIIYDWSQVGMPVIIFES